MLVVVPAAAVLADGAVTSGVVVDGAGVVGVTGVAATGGEVGVVAAGGGAAIVGVDGVTPMEVWFEPTAGGTVAPVLTPAEVALREVTGASGEAATVVVDRVR